jgi:putative zinc finger protein/photosynthesis system II assembly factor YCF48-like protein
MAELPKIVAQRLQTKPGDSVHPDPDLITAFVENALPLRDRNQLLAHLSHCADCREIVSFSLPEHPEAISTTARPAGSVWLSWPVLRWGALAACLVIVGAAVMLRHEAPKSQELIAQAPEVQTRNEQVPQSPAPPQPQAANQVASDSSRAMQVAHSAPPLARLKKEAPAAPTVGGPSTVASGIPPTVAQNDSAGAAPAAPTASMDELVPGRAKDVPLESREANASAGASARMQAQAKMSMSAVAMNKAASPSAKLVPRWTLTAEGTLERSLDSGTTWEAISVPGPAALRALAANGLDIWVGGSNGALYHSSDAGQHWTQVLPVANGELLSADIIGVEFTDLQHGTLTTSAKETWVTADAGQTWQKK